MHQHRLRSIGLLVACLICPLSLPRAKATPEPIVGTWELVGFGDVDGNVAPPDRLLITIDGSGHFDYQLSGEWDGKATSLKVSGGWALADNVLTLAPGEAEPRWAAVQVYRIAWDGRTLLLYCLEEGNRKAPPSRFAKRTAIFTSRKLSLPSDRIAGDSLTPSSALSGIRTALSRAPGEYVAAEIEALAVPQCDSAKDDSICTTDSKLLQVFASHGREFKTGDVLAVLSGGAIGKRCLVFLVPLAGRPTVFGATFLSTSVSDDDRRNFVADLREAGLQPVP